MREDRERREAVRLLRSGRRFVLVLHVRPDGDSVGSTLALARALRRLGKDAVVVRADAIPQNLAFLPGAREAVTADGAAGPFDVAVFLDCTGLDRIGDARRAVEGAGAVLNVDHHPSNTLFGDVNLVDPTAGAVGELTWELIADLGVDVDAEIATALFTAIATDTGSFRFENTTPRTLRIAAELVARGARPSAVAREVWENRTPASLRLTSLALGTLATAAEGSVAWIEVTPAMLRDSGALSEDTEGLVNYPRTMRGVEVAMLFVGEEGGRVRVSLRSNRFVDVGQLAAGFGGGGHARAAGCTVPGELAEVRDRLVEAAVRAVAEGARP